MEKNFYSTTGKKNVFIVTALFLPGGAGGGQPPEGFDKGGHGDDTGGGHWFYCWLASTSKKAKILKKMAEVTKVRENLASEMYRSLQGITPKQYLGFGLGTATTYLGGHYSSMQMNKNIIGLVQPQIGPLGDNISNLNNRMLRTTRSSSPRDLQSIIYDILVANHARTTLQNVADEFHNPSWIVYMAQLFLGVPMRRGGPTSVMPRIPRIDSNAAEHFFAIVFPFLNVCQVGNPVNLEWQRAADRLNLTLGSPRSVGELGNIIQRVNIDRPTLEIIIGLLFLLLPGGPASKRWFMLLPKDLPSNEKNQKVFSLILCQYGSMLFIFSRSICRYGVVFALFSLTSYMIGLFYLTILRLLIGDVELDLFLERFKTFTVACIMFTLEIPFWILAFLTVFFQKTYIYICHKLSERKKRVQNSFLKIYFKQLLNYLEEKGKENYNDEISFLS